MRLQQRQRHTPPRRPHLPSNPLHHRHRVAVRHQPRLQSTMTPLGHLFAHTEALTHPFDPPTRRPAGGATRETPPHRTLPLPHRHRLRHDHSLRIHHQRHRPQRRPPHPQHLLPPAPHTPRTHLTTLPPIHSHLLRVRHQRPPVHTRPALETNSADMRPHHLRQPRQPHLEEPISPPRPSAMPRTDRPLLPMNPPHRTLTTPSHTQHTRLHRTLLHRPGFDPYLLTSPCPDPACGPRRQSSLHLLHRATADPGKKLPSHRTQLYLLRLGVRLPDRRPPPADPTRQLFEGHPIAIGEPPHVRGERLPTDQLHPPW
jgi:hypothetical protein